MWHPDTERLQKIRNAYLSAREPLHEQEQKRQRAIWDRGGVLYNGEAIWEDNNQRDDMAADDNDNDDDDGGDSGDSDEWGQGLNEALDKGPGL